METTIPRASVWAKPRTVPEPRKPRTAAAIRVVTLPSMMADRAFWKPIFMAAFTVFPEAISSRIRAKMITFASTAMPMDRIMPATPGRVRVMSKPYRRSTMSSTYSPRARALARPGTQYTAIMKIMTIAMPIAPASRLFSIASLPSCAPTTLERSSSSSRLSPPMRMVEARFCASSKEAMPVITAWPSVMGSFTAGELTTWPS